MDCPQRSSPAANFVVKPPRAPTTGETALEEVESVEDRQVGRRYIRSGHRDGLNGARRENREQATLSILTPSYNTFTGADRRLEANQFVRACTCDLPFPPSFDAILS